MTTILFAWELGNSFGHISAMLPLALQLQQRGLRVVFVVRDTNSAEQLLAPHGIVWFQAPVSLHSKTAANRPSHNYGEILLHCGYDNPVALAGLIAGWQNLFALIQPALTVFEHSPTALLASRGFAMQRVVAGIGFFIPPQTTPFPDMYAESSVTAAELLASDALVLHNINLAMARRGLPALATLTELFAAERTWLCTFPELDHYRERAPCRYWGPQYVDDAGDAITWPDNDRKRIFIYLRPHINGFERLLSQLRLVDCEALVIAPGISERMIQRYHSLHIRFTEKLHNLASLAGQCDLAVLYGGHATMSICLLAGIPMLLLPQYKEQRMVVQRIVELGAALAVDRPAPSFDFGATVREMLVNPAYREAARAFAQKYAGFHPQHAAASMADEIIGLLPVTTSPIAANPST